ncbi:MAG: wax ester/triacylglycerol synthase family O-acyltransferase [Xanthomonadales bacterium]|nr:wax ester/triacylglycerol synthase family O-acyltransferase [Xanthomonadales bacterium]
MRKLSLLDLIFFLVESEDSPKHVAGLMRCKKPPKARADYCRRLFDELRTHDQLTEPFNLVINFVGLQGPHWEYCQDFSIDQHLFYHRPKRSLSWQEAKDLAAALHEPLMDRDKPLWEFHLIDGIKGGRFAIYLKLHHAYADGMTMTSWLNRSLSESPEGYDLAPVWELPPPRRSGAASGKTSLTSALGKLTGQAWRQVLTAGGIAKLSAQQYLERSGLTHEAVALLFSTAKDTPMTGSATPGRSIATSSVAMDRLNRLRKSTCSTLNHVALACIDGAMHRYLAASGIVLDHPISIQMPVNLRTDGDGPAGNKLGITLVDLARPTDDPYRRLREIGYKLRNVKNQVAGVPGSSFEQFTILVAGMSEVIDKLQLTDRLPTNGHTVVSNVPGPVHPLYLLGSRVERMYPISTLAPGLRLNITMFSYAGVLHFGLVGTRDLENLQDLADLVVDEFEALENAVASR